MNGFIKKYNMDASFDKLKLNINVVIQSIYFLIGIFGNLFVYIIYHTKTLRNFSTNIYFSIISILNVLRLIALWLQILIYHHKIGNLLMQISLNIDFSCRFIRTSVDFIYQFINILNAFITVDRLLSVLLPKITVCCHISSNNNSNNAKNKANNYFYQLLNVTIICITLVAVNIPRLIIGYDNKRSVNISINNLTINCAKIETPENTLKYYLMMLNQFLLTLVIPIVLISICTLVLVINLILSKKRLKKSLSKELRITKCLIATNLFFLLTNLPFCILYILSFIDRRIDLNNNYLFQLFYLLTGFFNSFYFLTHLLFNDLFRENFFRLI